MFSENSGYFRKKSDFGVADFTFEWFLKVLFNAFAVMPSVNSNKDLEE